MDSISFGSWVKQRRKAQHLTQRELATQAACAIATIKKIEADERRPSVEVAEMLAKALGVPQPWQERFVACARGQRSVSTLAAMGTNKPDENHRILPTPATPLQGRERELESIGQQLMQSDVRLLTLVGPGGIGKTRLAIEVARHHHDAFEDGVVFVPLAAISDAAHIPATVIHSLQLSLMGEDQLMRLLKQQHLLIVMDNCEQLGAGAVWMSKLLNEAPNVKILATSRERLHLLGEWIIQVPEMDHSQAVQLLKQSGQRLSPDVQVMEEDAASVCAVVENLPLAIELAAGWLAFMTCEQITASIRRDIDFLASNMRDAPARHRSIRAVFDYSWKMLSEQEQNTLMRLSVFRGGWTVMTSEPIANANPMMLRNLADKSLIRSSGRGRYDMHELTRQYLAEKRQQSGIENDVQTQYAETFIAFARDLFGALASHNDDIAEAFSQFNDEIDNFRAVLANAIERNDGERALRLATELFFFWLRGGYWREGASWLKAALAIAEKEPDKWTCIGLCNLGTFLAIQGYYAEADSYLARVRAVAHQIDDPRARITMSEVFLQAVTDIDEVGDVFQEIISLMETWEHPTKPGRFASAYTLYGDRLHAAGRYEAAQACFEESLRRFQDIGNLYMIAYPTGNLGRLALRHGDLDTAHKFIREATHISRQMGNRVDIADWVWQLGLVTLHMGEPQQAEVCFEEALALYEEVGNLRAIPDMQALLVHSAVIQDTSENVAKQLYDCLSEYRQLVGTFNALSSNYGAELTLPFMSALYCTLVLLTKHKKDECAVSLIGYLSTFTSSTQRLETRLGYKVTVARQQIQQRINETTYHASFSKGQSMSIADLLDQLQHCVSAMALP